MIGIAPEHALAAGEVDRNDVLLPLITDQESRAAEGHPARIAEGGLAVVVRAIQEAVDRGRHIEGWQVLGQFAVDEHPRWVRFVGEGDRMLAQSGGYPPLGAPRVRRHEAGNHDESQGIDDLPSVAHLM